MQPWAKRQKIKLSNQVEISQEAKFLHEACRFGFTVRALAVASLGARSLSKCLIVRILRGPHPEEQRGLPLLRASCSTARSNGTKHLVYSLPNRHLGQNDLRQLHPRTYERWVARGPPGDELLNLTIKESCYDMVVLATSVIAKGV